MMSGVESSMNRWTAIGGLLVGLLAMDVWAQNAQVAPRLPYAVVDTAQLSCYGNNRSINPPAVGQPFAGQDGCIAGRQPEYRDNRNGTVTDLVTGLMWQQDPGKKMTLAEARRAVSACRLGGHDDWRLPSIKELYSLIQFSGVDPDPRAKSADDLQPFIDSRLFDFQYGDPGKGERIIDAQYVSSTVYVGKTMRGDTTVFGVNFADGRIKGYPVLDPRSGRDKTFFVLLVRGNPAYGRNDYLDHGDGTITDRATGLMWMKQDSGHCKAGPAHDGAMDWEQSLEWAEGFVLAGHDDWRLPNAKELQSIVDYSRAPSVTGSAAIDPVFETSVLQSGTGKDFPYYWSSTTHVGSHGGDAAVYIAFGTAGGWMRTPRDSRPQLLDVHGAGAQRSDPKAGDASRFPYGRGPQGDVIRIRNHVRLVRNVQ